VALSLRVFHWRLSLATCSWTGNTTSKLSAYGRPEPGADAVVSLDTLTASDRPGNGQRNVMGPLWGMLPAATVET
jgi:hypothetical protein